MSETDEPKATFGGGLGCALMILAFLGGIAAILWVCTGGRGL